MIETLLATETHRPDWNITAGDWASVRIWGKPGGFKKFCSLSVMKHGAINAVVVMHDWRPEFGVIEISAAGGRGWQSRRVINEAMSICFDAMGCQTVTVRCSSNRADVITNMRRLGFSEAVLPNLRGPGIDEWVFTITATQWKSGRIYKAS